MTKIITLLRRFRGAQCNKMSGRDGRHCVWPSHQLVDNTTRQFGGQLLLSLIVWSFTHFDSELASTWNYQICFQLLVRWACIIVSVSLRTFIAGRHTHNRQYIQYKIHVFAHTHTLFDTSISWSLKLFTQVSDTEHTLVKRHNWLISGARHDMV